MLSALVLLMDTDHILEVVLSNGLTAQPELGASVQVTLLDADGAEVAGAPWPLALGWVDGSPGTYRVVLSDELEVVERSRLTAVIVATSAAGLIRTWYVPVVVQKG